MGILRGRSTIKRADATSLRTRCEMAITRKPRNLSKRKLLMGKKFHARTIDEADGRRSTVKKLRKDLQTLLKDTGADSIQKQILCKRAAFIALRLESMEADVADGK